MRPLGANGTVLDENPERGLLEKSFFPGFRGGAENAVKINLPTEKKCEKESENTVVDGFSRRTIVWADYFFSGPCSKSAFSSFPKKNEK